MTSSGLSALMIATQAVVGPGDRVVEVTPLWPNLVEIPKILGATGDHRGAALLARDGWSLDLDELLAALTPGTAALYLNSPNNPTGWTVEPAAQRAILEHCRRHGIWIFADDAYERLYYANGTHGPRPLAPSFLDICDPRRPRRQHQHLLQILADDRVPAGLDRGAASRWSAQLPKLIEYNTSCAPEFVQRAGTVAVTQGEEVVTRTVQRFRAARDFLVRAPARHAGRRGGHAAGRHVRRSSASPAWRTAWTSASAWWPSRGWGSRPASPSAPEGEGFIRWCFAASEERLADGVQRLQRALHR